MKRFRRFIDVDLLDVNTSFEFVNTPSFSGYNATQVFVLLHLLENLAVDVGTCFDVLISL